ncbi:hypothetical protein ANCCEY_05444 [Ancylostoma ceylanicum]|uniref:Uncharacterized protein n=1 Tax=Ancylostoma ceylanicum TaxID=53326 RepID=A0A0D6LUF2_9BILA|nr:hypothetical protein ANCCEY_05444 [Ancylostoma ceylanicum]
MWIRLERGPIMYCMRTIVVNACALCTWEMVIRGQKWWKCTHWLVFGLLLLSVPIILLLFLLFFEVLLFLLFFEVFSIAVFLLSNFHLLLEAEGIQR